jgi:hypothetical protein
MKDADFEDIRCLRCGVLLCYVLTWDDVDHPPTCRDCRKTFDPPQIHHNWLRRDPWPYQENRRVASAENLPHNVTAING